MAFYIIIISLLVFYSFLIFYYWQSWKSIPVFEATGTVSPVSISVIVPARNEEENIPVLLAALVDQHYPKDQFEIIVVDDHSTDRTAEIVTQFPQVKLIRLHAQSLNSYKKKAIETGIAAAAGELIITTDADCIPQPGWLHTIASFRQSTGAGFIVAPVAFDARDNMVEIFQALDFMILQGITGASVYNRVHAMCNGANLAYEKKLFDAVNGFSGIDHIASGDDMLLMHKIAVKFPGKIGYLKSRNAITSTRPMTSWKAFFSQRIRWASKATHYTDKRIFFVLLLVYLFNLSFPVLVIAGFVDPYGWLALPGLWLAKTLVELPFLFAVAGFFNRRHLLKYFFFLQPVHIFYTIIAGLMGQFGSYEWKGRRVK